MLDVDKHKANLAGLTDQQLAAKLSDAELFAALCAEEFRRRHRTRREAEQT